MLDYDREAENYDATRGGAARADAAAEAVTRLLPAGTRTLLDVACGTGIVTVRLRRPGRAVLGLDRSAGMLALAAGRLAPGAALLGDAARLPVADAGLDAVVFVWLLHLLRDAAPVLAEGARALRPGGVLVTTVDKDAAAYAEPSDVAEVTGPLRRRPARPASDRFDRVAELAAAHGLRLAGEAGFTGAGQGRSPHQWRAAITAGALGWSRTAAPGEVARVCRDLAALPDQDVPRPDPRYRLIALSRGPGS